jgi:hypothetical protein
VWLVTRAGIDLHGSLAHLFRPSRNSPCRYQRGSPMLCGVNCRVFLTMLCRRVVEACRDCLQFWDWEARNMPAAANKTASIKRA